MSSPELEEEILSPEISPKRRNRFGKWALVLFSLVGLSLFGFGVFRYFVAGPFGLHAPGHLVEAPSLPPRISFQFDEQVFFSEWKQHIFHERTTYQIETGPENERILHAISQGSSSGYFRELDLDLSQRPFLSWEWRAIQFPSNKKNEALAAKLDNDFAARVYAIFKGRTPLTSYVIQYVWDDHFPEGTYVESPYSKRVKILVVQSGHMESPDAWVGEKRDLVGDYEMLFGKRPRGNLLAIGLMSDADNTGTAAEAFYRRFVIERTQKDVKQERRYHRLWKIVVDLWDKLRITSPRS